MSQQNVHIISLVREWELPPSAHAHTHTHTHTHTSLCYFPTECSRGWNLTCTLTSPPPPMCCLSTECSHSYPCQGMGPHAHFRDFGTAMLTLFRIATGDNWNGILKVHSKVLFHLSSLTSPCARLAQLVRSLTASQKVPGLIPSLVEG